MSIITLSQARYRPANHTGQVRDKPNARWRGRWPLPRQRHLLVTPKVRSRTTGPQSQRAKSQQPSHTRYVILENHLHAVVVSSDPSKEIGDFKSFTARQIIDHLEAKGANTLLKLLRHLKAR